MSWAKNKAEKMNVLYVILLPPNISQTKVLSDQRKVLSYYCISVPIYGLTCLEKNSWLKIVLLIAPNHVVVLLMRGWLWSSSPIINITHYNQLGQRWAQFVYLISN